MICCPYQGESNDRGAGCQLQQVFRSQETRYWTKVLLTPKVRVSTASQKASATSISHARLDHPNDECKLMITNVTKVMNVATIINQQQSGVEILGRRSNLAP